MRKPRPPSPFATSHATLWPFADYPLWIEALRCSIGETIYLAEIHLSEIHASAELSSQGYELLALLDFPRPDPQRRLYPHLILLDDGRGINLGRIARISRHTPYRPASEDLLYLEQQLCDEQLYRPQRLTPQRIATTSRQLLGKMLAQRPQLRTLGKERDTPLVSLPPPESEADE